MIFLGYRQEGEGAGDVTLEIQNTGTMATRARATAEAPGNASAFARATGVRQLATAGQTADATLTNGEDANIIVNATAIANGDSATARVEAAGLAVLQFLDGEDANALIDNDGDIAIVGLAEANAASGPAEAIALGSRLGVAQDAFVEDGDGAGAATLVIDNDGAITRRIDAVATADEDVANAFAGALDVVRQIAQADTAAQVVLTNNGELSQSVAASASGDTANATAVSAGFLGAQLIQAAFGTTAAATLVNNGTMTFAVSADAVADVGAASAFVRNDGVLQFAVGENGASATYENGPGSRLVVTADADAVSPTVANADAQVSYAIQQFVQVTGDGDGLARIDNQGAITAAASADAQGGTAAFASATVENGLLQEVFSAGDGNTTAQINNVGTVNISALADASAGAGTTAPDGDGFTAPEATARARVGNGVSQTVSNNNNPAVGEDDTVASASFNNGGTLNINATANAVVAADPAVEAAQFGNALADARVNTAVDQTAIGNGGADANVAITNDGALVVNVVANADGHTRADALAINGNGVLQTVITNQVTIRDGDTAVTFAGTASAALINNGTMSFAVSAQADAEEGEADAFASNDGVFQLVIGAGDSTATYDSDADSTLVVTAEAEANSPTVEAFADVTFAIAQLVDVTGDGDGLAQIDNEGVITAAAAANAEGGTRAFANANVEDGLIQAVEVAGEGNATGQINNVGTITVAALANASAAAGATPPVPDPDADDPARAATSGASAEVERGISQRALANNDPATDDVGALASVIFDNGGDLTIVAAANAEVAEDAAVDAAQFGNAFASASVGIGVEQDATGNGGADAIGSVTNAGTLTVGAIAAADGLTRADAFAVIANGVDQHVFAGEVTIGEGDTAVTFAGDASATLTNSGTMTFAAVATATAEQGPANAFAIVGNIDFDDVDPDDLEIGDLREVEGAIHQRVNAAGNGSATVNNSGTLDVSADATAIAVQPDDTLTRTWAARLRLHWPAESRSTCWPAMSAPP